MYASRLGTGRGIELPKPRIPSIPVEERSPEVLQLLTDSVVPDTLAVNIFATFARHPGLMRRWIPYCAKLLVAGKIPERDREIVILRTAYSWRAAYEWGQHSLVAAAAGFSPSEIEGIVHGPESSCWTRHEKNLIRAVDEVRSDGEIGDQTWEQLRLSYTDQQMIELPFLIGAYSTVAFFVKSLRVEPEDGLPTGFPEAVNR